MKLRRIWSSSDIEAVERKYADERLYQTLRPVALRWSRPELALTPAETFYHVVRSLDELRGKADKSERLDYCRSLHDEMRDYILSRAEAEERQADQAVTLVVAAVSVCLYAVDRHRYHDEMLALNASLQHDSDTAMRMLDALRSIADRRQSPATSEWLRAYFRGRRAISDEIEDMLRMTREAARQEDARLQSNIVNNYNFNGTVGQVIAHAATVNHTTSPHARQNETTY